MTVTTNELIPISEKNGRKAVNARDLHNFLESKRDFSNWIKDRIEKYDFIKNQDYQVFNKIGGNPKGGRPSIDYALSIGMAKELSMIENNERGKQARKYFIACEENSVKPELSRKELALMVVQAEEEKERLLLISEQQQATIEIQEEEIKKAAPKVNYYDTTLQSVNTLTTTQVAKEIGMEAFKLNKKLKECGVIYKQSGQWLFHAPYSNWGLHGTRTQTFTRSDGSTGTSIYTVFTQRGRRFIHALYDNEWDVKKAIKQIKDELTPGT